MDKTFWQGKRVLITGVTGFKGCWIAKTLDYLGANVFGIALQPDYGSVYNELSFSSNYEFKEIDTREYDELKTAICQFKPEIVIHLAAQAIVKTARIKPLDTFETNVMGTVNLLDILKDEVVVKSIVIVTSDKVYDNQEMGESYTEELKLSGNEPYSCSKVCQEMVAKAYRETYFNEKNVGVATARAANVFGGGDNHFDRLIPYLIKTAIENEDLILRNPDAVRPWQYITDVVEGYLLLAQNLYNNPRKYSQAWNFGPSTNKLYTVREMTNIILNCCDRKGEIEVVNTCDFKESKVLMINSEKSYRELGWQTKYTVEEALVKTVDMYKKYLDGESINDLITQEITDLL